MTTNDVPRTVQYDAAGNETSCLATRTYSSRNLLAQVADLVEPEDPFRHIIVSYDDQESWNHELKHVALFDKYIYSQAIAKLLPMEKKIFKKYADCRNAAIAAKDTVVEAVNDQPWSETWKHSKLELPPCPGI